MRELLPVFVHVVWMKCEVWPGSLIAQRGHQLGVTTLAWLRSDNRPVCTVSCQALHIYKAVLLLVKQSGSVNLHSGFTVGALHSPCGTSITHLNLSAPGPFQILLLWIHSLDGFYIYLWCDMNWRPCELINETAGFVLVLNRCFVMLCFPEILSPHVLVLQCPHLFVIINHIMTNCCDK